MFEENSPLCSARDPLLEIGRKWQREAEQEKKVKEKVMDIMARVRKADLGYLVAKVSAPYPSVIKAINALFDEGKVQMTDRPFIFQIK